MTGMNVSGASFRWDAVGFRAGLAASSSGTEFNQAEIVSDWDLPWEGDLGSRWWLHTRLDLSAGWLGSRSANAAIGTVGPVLVLGRGEFPISIEVGTSPTLLSRSDLGAKDFGTCVQFTSHLGVNWDLNRHLRFGGRIQHMSNAHLSNRNPGLNLFALGVSYVF
jgi:lipid A 3-O-deacylase